MPSDSSRKKKSDKRKPVGFSWGLLLIPLVIILAIGYFIYQGRGPGEESAPESVSVDQEEQDSSGHELPELQDSAPKLPAEFKVFFGNEDFNSNMADCGDVFPVYRATSEEDDVMKEALLSLLGGPSELEQERKYYTYLNPGIRLLGLKNENATIYADFSRELERDVAGSCDTIAIRAQIVETLMQFEGVDRVVIMVEGNSEGVLQP